MGFPSSCSPSTFASALEPLACEPLCHQRQESRNGRVGRELIERGVEESLDRLLTVDAVELASEPGSRRLHGEALIQWECCPRGQLRGH